MIKLALELCLILGIIGRSVEYLPFGLTLEWYFPDEETITFEYHVPRLYEEVFGWAGLAFQSTLESMEDFRCDYYIALLDGEGVMTDRYAETNGYPPFDIEQGGTNDLTSSREYRGNYLVLIFTRKLDTGDDCCDIVMTKNSPILVKWALGPIIDGYIEQHSLKFMGYEYFIIRDEYEDDNLDERGTYGPFHNQHEDRTVPRAETKEKPDEEFLAKLKETIEKEELKFGSKGEWLTKDMSLYWEFGQGEKNDELTLYFYVPSWTLEGYDWILLGFVDAADPEEMQKCDCYMAELPNGLLTDRFTMSDHGIPQLDQNLGGTDDIHSETRSIGENWFEYKITRKFNTGDNYDIKFEIDRAYKVRWELGNKDSEGNYLNAIESGTEYFLLRDRYEDRNIDEVNVFGPHRIYGPGIKSIEAIFNEGNAEWTLEVESDLVKNWESATQEIESRMVSQEAKSN